MKEWYSSPATRFTLGSLRRPYWQHNTGGPVLWLVFLKLELEGRGFQAQESRLAANVEEKPVNIVRFNNFIGANGLSLAPPAPKL
jgi:hypothetical protein